MRGCDKRQAAPVPGSEVEDEGPPKAELARGEYRVQPARRAGRVAMQQRVLGAEPVEDFLARIAGVVRDEKAPATNAGEHGYARRVVIPKLPDLEGLDPD